MKKYSVVIIDDEKMIIEGLKIMIDWKAYHCTVIGTCMDGEAGLKMIQDLQPDIVISDIQMPNSNGIDMIKEALAFSEARFIIISGFANFKYAQQCISLGIKEYLLKPIEEEALCAALLKLQKEITVKQQEQDQLKVLKKNYQDISLLVRDHNLRDFVNSYFTDDADLISALENYELYIPDGICTCVVFESDADFADPDRMRQILDANIKALLGEDSLLFLYTNRVFMAILIHPNHFSADALIQHLSYIRKLIAEAFHLQLNVGAGNSYTHLRDIYISSKQAFYALSYKMIRGKNSVNYFSKNLENAHFIISVPPRLWDTYKNSLTSLSIEKINTSVHEVYCFLKHFHDMPIAGFQLNSSNIIYICIQTLYDMDIVFDDVDFSEMDCFSHLSALQSLDEMEQYVRSIIYKLISTLKEHTLKRPSSIISQVIEYLKNNVYEDLGLVPVAKRFYISPIYLSQLFKKETGQLYLDYVTNLKMQEAKRLLMSTRYMVYEIAEKLGYRDSRYFSRLFEKRVGCKPSEFRK